MTNQSKIAQTQAIYDDFMNRISRLCDEAEEQISKIQSNDK
jgi:hypothetical protein